MFSYFFGRKGTARTSEPKKTAHARASAEAPKESISVADDAYPLSAYVPRWNAENGRFWFIVRVIQNDGYIAELKRYLSETHALRGRLDPSLQATLPPLLRVPNYDTYASDDACEARRKEVNAFIYSLVEQGEEVQKLQIVKRFFRRDPGHDVPISSLVFALSLEDHAVPNPRAASNSTRHSFAPSNSNVNSAAKPFKEDVHESFALPDNNVNDKPLDKKEVAVLNQHKSSPDENLYTDRLSLPASPPRPFTPKVKSLGDASPASNRRRVRVVKPRIAPTGGQLSRLLSPATTKRHRQRRRATKADSFEAKVATAAEEIDTTSTDESSLVDARSRSYRVPYQSHSATSLANGNGRGGRKRGVRNTDGLFDARQAKPLLHRSQSWQSHVSSANVSLRDDRPSSFDKDYQNPDFSRPRAHSAASSYEIPTSPRALLPIPLRQSSSSPPSKSPYIPDVFRLRRLNDTEAEVEGDQDTTFGSYDSPPRLSASPPRRIPRRRPTQRASLAPLLSKAQATSNVLSSKHHTDQENILPSGLDPKAEASGIGNANGANTTTTGPGELDDIAPLRECYMCGRTVMVLRARDWQRHVLDDLRPYQCIELECHVPQATYSRLHHLRDHYKSSHPKSALLMSLSIKCPFCEIEIHGRDKLHHIGEHMEEMAFAVVPRQYEGWDWYSDSEACDQGRLSGLRLLSVTKNT